MLNYNLYLHLSFDSKLAKLIKPRLPATIDSTSKGDYSEPDIPRITGEIWLTRATSFELIDRVRVFNTNSSEGLYYHPFNKPSLPLKYLGPKSIRYETLGLP